MVAARHHRPAARGLDRRGDARVVGRHHDRADVGFDRPAPDVDDHRLAADVGERLARQAGRSHACGNENDRIDHADLGRGGFAESGLYELPTPRQSGYSSQGPVAPPPWDEVRLPPN